MDVELINHFLNAVYECMETTVRIQPERQSPYLKDNHLTQGDITGTIVFAEKGVMGSISLGYPAETILKIYNILADGTESSLTKEVQDLVGELTNIVAVGANKEFSQSGISFKISTPIVIVGKNRTIHHQIRTPVTAIPFLLDKSPFTLEVTMKTELKLK